MFLVPVFLKDDPMNNRMTHGLLAAVTMLAILLSGSQAVSQLAEPPRLMELRVGGQAHRMVAGQKISLDLTGKTEVELVELPNRLFGHGGVEFQYPEKFEFEADIDGEIAAWHLDTEIAGLIFEEIPLEDFLTAEAIATEIVRDFETEARYVPREIRLGDTMVKGIEAIFTVEVTTFSYEVYPVASTGGHRFLVLQDLLDEDGENSRDYFELRKAITGSFRILRPEVQKYVK